MSATIPTEGLGMPVEVGAIDTALKKLWEADEASTNASLMNFLVYTEDPQRLQKNSSKMNWSLTKSCWLPKVTLKTWEVITNPILS